VVLWRRENTCDVFCEGAGRAVRVIEIQDDLSIRGRGGVTISARRIGLFAAGDVTNVKDKQIVIAAGQGALATMGVFEYLLKKR